MKRGYIPLYRKVQDHEFYKEKRIFSKLEAWIDMLMEVQQKIEQKEVLIGMSLVNCGHGQSLNSLRTWGNRWGWSGKKVSRFFNLLEKMDQIRSENVTVTTRITILNYSKYDIKCHTDVTQLSHEGNTVVTRLSHECPTDKNVNNEKNDKNVKNTKGKKFKKPSLEDVQKYCLENNYCVDPEKFIDYYTSNGWKVGKNSMKCWKAAVRTWEKNNNQKNNQQDNFNFLRNKK